MMNPFYTPSIYRFDYLGLKTGRLLFETLIPETIGPPRPLDILDVGCGTAPWKPLFKNYTGTYTGLDITPGPGVDLVASADDMPLDNDTYDAIISISALEHICNCQNAVAEMRRVLRPGGVAFVGVPFFWEVHGHPHDYWRWTPSGLKELFSDFDSCDVHHIGGPWTNFLSIQNLYLRHAQLAVYPLRMFITPLIFFNNLLGWLGIKSRRTTTSPTFYVAVARA